jgi:holliday junction DNA helicase RuvA
MIASLRGTLLERSGAHAVIECAGVGYLVSVSAHTASALPAVGEPVSLRTRQIVREDSLQLFAFADAEELRLFDLLIGVNGVGPRLALAVLSGLKPQALARAIRDEQVASLVAIPGIGRKTAERLVVELRDKLDPLAPGAPSARDGAVLPRNERFEDAVAALVVLGYTASQATETVRRVAEAEPDLSLEDLVRRALARLGKAAITSMGGSR